MARLPRVCLPGIPLHVIQRRNNRQVCVGSDEDLAAYAHWLEEYARKLAVAIHAWVFMPSTGSGVSELMQALERRYVRYFNLSYKRSGTLSEGRFRSCVVDAENYLLLCQR
jgi:putative transposase